MATRRTALGLLGASAAALLAPACAPTRSAVPTPVNPLIKPRAEAGAPLTPVLASSELAIGRNRFALGLIDARNQPIASGQVLVEFFKVDPRNGTAEKRSEGPATFRAVELVEKGIWVLPAELPEAGPWGAQVTVSRPGEAVLRARLNFEVRPTFSAPGYGAPAPRSSSLTVQDVGGDASRLCSNVPPCDLHSVSIQDALARGAQPLVVLFATPALCTSATCAPQLNAVQSLRRAGYADRATFIHVEVYAHPFEQLKPAKTVEEWRLPSEPWVFVVDRQGVVRDRFEGSAPLEEMEPALRDLV